MARTLRKSLESLAAALLLLTSVGGCRFFALSNPLLPEARLFAVPEPTMIVIENNFKTSDRTITTTVREATIKVSSFPRDSSPGVQIFSYSAEYFDQAGKSIPTLQLSKVNFGVAGFVPPASQGEVSTTSMTLPIYNQQVRLYGIDQSFNLVGEPDLNRNLIHTINCRVTLYGEDDNFNQIQVPFNVPIRFDGNITR